MAARRVGIAIALAGLAAMLLGAFIVVSMYRSPMRTPGAVVLLRPGIGAREVAAELAAHGVLPYPRLFLLIARATEVDRGLQAGRYAVPPDVSIESLLALLHRGPNLREKVTIPEGSRAEEIASILARAADVDSAAFLAVVRDPRTPARFGVPGPSLEGYLFPETYEFSYGIGAAEAASLLVAEYREVMTPALLSRADSLGMDERGVVTLASIIEAETPLDEERPRVSAVFHNRLRAGWPLEADPTVRYATGNDTGQITAGQLQSESPYNTYHQPGLPPGPIGSPGRAALSAALNPSEDCRDFFFVADGTGGHTFSRTVDQHAKAVVESRRAARDSTRRPSS
jgi:UPF0755 protein